MINLKRLEQIVIPRFAEFIFFNQNNPLFLGVLPFTSLHADVKSSVVKAMCFKQIKAFELAEENDEIIVDAALGCFDNIFKAFKGEAKGFYLVSSTEYCEPGVLSYDYRKTYPFCFYLNGHMLTELTVNMHAVPYVTGKKMLKEFS